MAALRREIAELFPPGVEGEELHFAEEAQSLFPEEEVALARAVEKRRTEFALGRTAARSALRALGVAPQALPALPDRSVAWPEHICGSITHTEGLCIAVASPREQLAGIGIDAELRNRVEPRLWRMIATERERARLEQGATEEQRLLRAALLFSAKESFYKAQFCVSRAWVGFHDAELEIDETGAFELRLLKEVNESFTLGSRFVGRYTVLAQHVVTGLAIFPR